MNYDDNWLNRILDNAVRTVEQWPEWMRRPEMRVPGSSGANAYDGQQTRDDKSEQVTVDSAPCRNAGTSG